MIAPQISGTATPQQQQRIPRKPTLLEVINGNRCVTMIRLAQASQVERGTLLAAMQSNTVTPKVAEKIVAGLTKLTNHRWSIADIDMAVHPSRR